MNTINGTPFLRTSRQFPEDLHQLTVEVNKSYIDIANIVNLRVIGSFPTNRAAQNGKNWYLNSTARQQGFQQVYTFGATGAGVAITDIPLGFKLSSITEPGDMYGQYLSGTSWFGLIAANSIAIAGQISFYLAVVASPTSDVIRFVVDAGAPAVVRGKVVIEWIADP